MPIDQLIHQTRMALWEQIYSRWITQEVFSSPWWITILFLIGIYVVWFRLLDRSRLISILLLGSFAAVVSTVIHQIGTSMVLWENKISLLPMIGPVFPFDYTVVPILVMLTYQYTDTWLKFYVGTLISGGVYCFVILPVFQAIGASQFHHNWLFAVLFITYTACSLAARYIILSLIGITDSFQAQSNRSGVFRPAVRLSAKPMPQTIHSPEDKRE